MAESRSRAAALYREYGPAVYRRCLRLLRDREVARDATQDVFVKLVANMERLGDRETVLPWIYRVATNHCLNLRRNAVRRGEGSIPELEVAEAPRSEGVPERALAQAVLSRFDERTRAIAVGVLVDEMDQEELAEALGISRRTVARALDRFLGNARKFLRRSET